MSVTASVGLTDRWRWHLCGILTYRFENVHDFIFPHLQTMSTSTLSFLLNGSASHLVGCVHPIGFLSPCVPSRHRGFHSSFPMTNVPSPSKEEHICTSNNVRFEAQFYPAAPEAISDALYGVNPLTHSKFWCCASGYAVIQHDRI